MRAALSLCRSEVNPRFIEMCTEDWKGTGSENLVTVYTTSKLLCQGLSCRLFFGTLSEAWYSPESPHPTPGQPFQPELTMPFTSLWGGQGLGDFLLFMWFSLMKFSSCKSWHLLDGFQVVRKTVPCQKAKHYSPSTEVYPWNQRPFWSQGHGQNHSSGPHWAIYHLYRCMLGKLLSGLAAGSFHVPLNPVFERQHLGEGCG